MPTIKNQFQRVTTPVLCTAIGILGCVSVAFAVGPQAPFTPPHAALNHAAAPASAASDAHATLPQGLLGLRLGPTPAALIDGLWIQIGQLARGARLVAVQPGQARLRHADGRVEALHLFADPSAAAWRPRSPLSTQSAALRELP